MKNKVLVRLIVPEIDEVYNVYIPVNRKVGNVILLIGKALTDLTNGIYQELPNSKLYDTATGDFYPVDILVKNTNIRNGSSLVLL